MDIFNNKKLRQKALDKIELTKLVLWYANPKINSIKMENMVHYRDLVITNDIYVDEDAIVLTDKFGTAFERIELRNFIGKIQRDGLYDLTIDISTGDVLVY